MAEPTYRSSSLYAWFIPLGTCVLCALAILNGLFLLVTSRELGSLIWIAIGTVLLVLYARSRGRFGIVTVNSDGVSVEQQGITHSFSWPDVASCRTIPFVVPAVYRITFHTSPLVTYFVPPRSGSVHLGFWTFHWSAMGTFIREQLRQCGTSGALR